jgi:hypothetical protein
MAAIKRFNWVRNPTAWESTQGWREKQRAASESFTSAAASAFEGFQAAWSGAVSGAVQNTTQTALARIQAESQASLKASSSALGSSLNLTV